MFLVYFLLITGVPLVLFGFGYILWDHFSAKQTPASG
jgi:hypothetical protein